MKGAEIMSDISPDTDTKPPLAHVLKTELKKQGINLDVAARTLSLSPSTLRGWILRNTFPIKVIPQLASLAGLPGDFGILEGRYAFERTTHESRPPIPTGADISDPLVWYRFLEMSTEQFVNRISRHGYKSVRHDLAILFGALGAGDIVVNCDFDSIPEEMDLFGWSVLGSEILRAIRRGAYLIYFHPSARLIAMAKDCHAKISDTSEFSRIFQEFRARIESAIETSGRDPVCSRVVAIEYDVPIVPLGYQYSLYAPKHSEPRALAIVNTQYGQWETRMHLPIGPALTRQFANLIMTIMRRQGRDDLLRLFCWE